MSKPAAPESGWLSWESSNVVGGAYDASGRNLFIRFKGGRVYVYYDVPVSVWEGIQAAGSKGKYHDQHVKWAFFYDPL